MGPTIWAPRATTCGVHLRAACAASPPTMFMEQLFRIDNESLQNRDCSLGRERGTQYWHIPLTSHTLTSDMLTIVPSPNVQTGPQQDGICYVYLASRLTRSCTAWRSSVIRFAY